MKKAAVTFLLALFAIAAAAQDPKPAVEAIGTLERVLDDRGAVAVYLDLAPGAKPPVITEVTRDGVAVSVSLFAVTYANDALHIAARDLPKLEAGTYAIGVRIPPPDPADPKKPTHKASDFTVKVKRNVPAAEKAVLTADTLRAERTVYIPGLWSTWQPERWTMQETGGKSGVTIEKPSWTVSLATGAVNPDKRTLRIDVVDKDGKTTEQAKLVAGQTAELKAAPVERNYPLGKMTGKFKMQAKELAAPVDVNVEVITRWSRVVLFALLIASIWLGWLTRTKLENRRLVAAARIAANHELARQKDILASIRDPHYVKTIDAIVDGLKAAIGLRSATAINDKVTAAKTAIQAAIDEMTAKEKEARTFVTQIREAVFDGRGQTGEMQQLATKTNEQLAAIEKKLERGLVIEPRSEAARLAGDLPKDALSPINGWKEAMSGLVDELQKWPEANPGDLAETEKKIQAMASADLNAVKSSFAEAAGANSFLTARYRETVAPNILGIAETVEQGLARVRKQDALREAREKVGQAGTDLQEPSKVRDALKTLHRATVDALTAAVPAGKPAPAEIAQNKFLDALGAVKKLRATDTILKDQVVEPAGAPFTARGAGGEPASPEPPLLVTIEQSGPAVAGERLTLTATVTAAGAPVELVTVQWEAGDVTYTGRVGEMTFSFVPQTTHPTEVKAHVVATIDGQLKKADAIKRIVPLPAELFDVEILEAEETTAKLWQTAIAGALIVLAGVFIVFKDWVGTPADFIAAAFWGFAADISVATILTFAEPLKTKKLFS